VSEEVPNVAPESEIDALGEKLEPEPEDKKDAGDGQPAEEPDEEKEEPEVGDEEEEEEKPEEEETEESPKAIRFSEIKKEFPELFKKYPDLRANYFQAEKFKEFFPTVEDAEEAARKAEVFDVANEELSRGDFGNLIITLGNNNPKSLEKVADEILPKLYSIDSRLYSRATIPVLKQMLSFAAREAVRINDENLKNSVGHLAKFVFGSSGVPSDQRPTQQEDPEKLQLQQQNQALISSQARNYYNDVVSESFNEFKREVLSGLDEEKKLTPWHLDKLAEDIMSEVDQILAKDIKHQREMNSLWNRAYQSGFPADMKAKLLNAHLARAKMIIPAIRQRKKSEAMGTKAPENGQKRTMVPQNSGPARKTNPKFPSAQEAKKQGLSELDILNRV
jgi:hypothetical protein